MDNESLENEFSLQSGQFPLPWLLVKSYFLFNWWFFVPPAMFVQECCWVVDGEILAKLLTWRIYVIKYLRDPMNQDVNKSLKNDSPKGIHSEQSAETPSS